MWIRLYKVTTAAAKAATGFSVYFYLIFTDYKRKCQNSYKVKPVLNDPANWNYNWDFREPKSLVIKFNPTLEDRNEYKKKIAELRPTIIRHIILVRHCEYLNIGYTDSDKHLTEVGRTQAKYTGERLKSLDIKWKSIISSTMTRAQETAKIITDILGCKITENSNLIREGKLDDTIVGARIEDGFHKYFHRGDVKENIDTYTLIVSHANVIRYMVCRVLQISPQVWERFSVYHGSITWISILPSGRVKVRSLGDSGHIPPDMITNYAQTVNRHCQ